MNFFRKNSLGLAGFALGILLSILAAESFHHHEGVGAQDRDCSLCSWQVTSSNATTPVVPILPFFALVAILVLVFKTLTLTSFTLSPRGRSPPQFPL
jgi:hypothetical protein